MNSQDQRKWLLNASPRDIQLFIHELAGNQYSGEVYEFARTALEVSISKDQAASAQKLERQTDTLIILTKSLKLYTVMLFVLTAVLAGIEVFHLFERHLKTAKANKDASQSERAPQQPHTN